MDYNEAMLTVMIYFGFVTIVAFWGIMGFVVMRAIKVLNKIDKFLGYGIGQEEIKIRDDD